MLSHYGATVMQVATEYLRATQGRPRYVCLTGAGRDATELGTTQTWHEITPFVHRATDS